MIWLNGAWLCEAEYAMLGERSNSEWRAIYQPNHPDVRREAAKKSAESHGKTGHVE